MDDMEKFCGENHGRGVAVVYMFFSQLFFLLYYRARNAVLGIPDAITAAKRLQGKASKQAFRVYRGPLFRKSVFFDALATVEQDRMFNELIVANLVLEILMMETFAKFAHDVGKEWTRAVAENIPTQFVASLRALSIVEEYMEIWRKLITLRQDEYEHMRLEHRDRFSELGEGNPWIRVVAIGCLFHIRRRKGIPNDPLLPLLIEQAIAIAQVTRRSINPVAFGAS